MDLMKYFILLALFLSLMSCGNLPQDTGPACWATCQLQGCDDYQWNPGSLECNCLDCGFGDFD